MTRLDMVALKLTYNPTTTLMVRRNLDLHSVSRQQSNQLAAGFGRQMSQYFNTILGLEPHHRVGQNFYHGRHCGSGWVLSHVRICDSFAFALNCAVARSKRWGIIRNYSPFVKIMGPLFVTATVCSKWAEGDLSTVTTVQPSDLVLTS